MKDRAYLLIAAIAMSVFAWLYWHFGGKYAVGVLMSFLLVVLVVDNFQLRRQLRGIKQEKKGP
jgi:Flp pilus assembly protein TadB